MNSKNRKSCRFLPEDVYYIELKKDKSERDNIVYGFIRDESYTGCCGIFRKPFKFAINEEIVITVGKFDDLQGYIRWIEDLDEALVKVGIEINL